MRFNQYLRNAGGIREAPLAVNGIVVLFVMCDLINSLEFFFRKDPDPLLSPCF